MENKEKTPHNLNNFLGYYKELNIFETPEEYEIFSQYLLKDLPISFRLNTLQYFYVFLQIYYNSSLII